MKASAYLLTVLLSATQALAECVEGTREEISPGYTVEHKCNIYRKGDDHKNIPSAKECAALARDAGISVSTYHPPSKKCIVGRDDGKDIPYSGTIFMQKVVDEPEDDPFAPEEDPFALDCDAERDECLAQKATLQAELEATKTECASKKADADLAKDILASTCPFQHAKDGTVGGKEYRFWCARWHDDSGSKERHHVPTMEACLRLCNARSWCTYALHGVFNGFCQLYDRKISYATTPGVCRYDINSWHCAVKK
ncbi:hypothetical protein FACUT_13902 [Fusarium acutatum]|uniref:Apple domain-containing protein n=1 Tax=Fusarium acutatum TaxID=78861 RepID=A0A8H4JAY0_9HYPO|nr:hypothetical protein FACUT_13902 [Fusarium acutatum]